MAEVERWLPSSVDGLEVSSLGRIRVVPYTKEMPHGGLRWYGGHAWFGNIARDASRPRRVFRFRGNTHKVHRLVCEAFHGPEPLENADVLHRNGNTLDNVEANLRWATRAEILAQVPMEIAA
ncbi:HNH endonuclease [Mesorhizobium sp. M0045]|uniref:HNH endonuclease n=1 Tax=Mesorhizobium sp. M0045 TaxID=2956857 RepID=UPI00333C7B4B